MKNLAFFVNVDLDLLSHSRIVQIALYRTYRWMPFKSDKRKDGTFQRGTCPLRGLYKALSTRIDLVIPEVSAVDRVSLVGFKDRQSLCLASFYRHFRCQNVQNNIINGLKMQIFMLCMSAAGPEPIKHILCFYLIAQKRVCVCVVGRNGALKGGVGGRFRALLFTDCLT